jgi:REP element-mobilizing transposase RayT
MAFIRVWIHYVFVTKNEENFFTEELLQKIQQHIKESSLKSGIVTDKVNGFSNHVHVLLALGDKQSVSETARILLTESSNWINFNKLTGEEPFEWSDRYFAVSVSQSQIDTIREYIKNQPVLHQKKDFETEYRELIEKYGFG